MTRTLKVPQVSVRFGVSLLFAFALVACCTFAVAPRAQAAGLTEMQMKAIVTLLASFEVDAGTIANVERVLKGEASSKPATKSEAPSKSAVADGEVAKKMIPGQQVRAEAPGVAGAPAQCRFLRSMVQGVKDEQNNDEVIRLQAFLADEGYLNASSTGFFGPMTREAVGRWQVAQKIASPDEEGHGMVGPRTRTALMERCAALMQKRMDAERPVPEQKTPESLNTEQPSAAVVSMERTPTPLSNFLVATAAAPFEILVDALSDIFLVAGVR